MMIAPRIDTVEYHVDEPDDDAEERDDMPLLLRRFFEARRRALITELRQIETALGRPQSIPERQRPH